MSQVNKFHYAVIALILLVLAGHSFLPPKRELLFPHTQVEATLYSDEAWGGNTKASWLGDKKQHWRCQLTQGNDFPVCGLALSFPYNTGTTRDFSSYEALSIDLSYTGEANKLRVYLRNYNPEYSTLKDVDSLKFNATSLHTKEFAKGEVTIQMSEFSVGDWWLEERNIPREWSHPEINRVTALGIDFPAPLIYGQHDIKINQITLIGPWIRKETLYLSIIIFGLALVVGEALLHLFLSYKIKRRQ